MSKYIKTGLENYYGELVFLQVDNGPYYMRLEGLEGYSFVEIPENIYLSLEKYFNENNPEVIYE